MDNITLSERRVGRRRPIRVPPRCVVDKGRKKANLEKRFPSQDATLAEALFRATNKFVFVWVLFSPDLSDCVTKAACVVSALLSVLRYKLETYCSLLRRRKQGQVNDTGTT